MTDKTEAVQVALANAQAAVDAVSQRIGGGHAMNLGDRVRIHGTVTKAHDWDGENQITEFLDSPPPSDWTGPKDAKLRIYTEGVIVGKRNMPVGSARTQYGASVFRTTSVVPVYLVAYHMNRKHALCRPDQIERITP